MKRKLIHATMPPIEAALSKETEGYEWKRETGDIESYKHDQTGGWLHIDPRGQFYDRNANAITRGEALANTIEQQFGHHCVL